MNCPSKLSLAFLSGILKLYYLVFSDLSWKSGLNPKHCGGNKSGKLQVKCIIEYLSGKTQNSTFLYSCLFSQPQSCQDLMSKKSHKPSKHQTDTISEESQNISCSSPTIPPTATEHTKTPTATHYKQNSLPCESIRRTSTLLLPFASTWS